MDETQDGGCGRKKKWLRCLGIGCEKMVFTTAECRFCKKCTAAQMQAGNLPTPREISFTDLAASLGGEGC